MEDFKKVDILENEDEARLLGSILTERSIPHNIRSYHDTAFNGLYQAQKGWGNISAPPSCHPEIKEIISELRDKANEQTD